MKKTLKKLDFIIFLIYGGVMFAKFKKTLAMLSIAFIGSSFAPTEIDGPFSDGMIGSVQAGRCQLQYIVKCDPSVSPKWAPELFNIIYAGVENGTIDVNTLINGMRSLSLGESKIVSADDDSAKWAPKLFDIVRAGLKNGTIDVDTLIHDIYSLSLGESKIVSADDDSSVAPGVDVSHRSSKRPRGS